MRLGRWEIFRRIKPYARESRWLIVVMLLCSAAAVPVSLVNPVFFQILIDDVMRERQIAVFYQVVVGAAGGVSLPPAAGSRGAGGEQPPA